MGDDGSKTTDPPSFGRQIPVSPRESLQFWDSGETTNIHGRSFSLYLVPGLQFYHLPYGISDAADVTARAYASLCNAYGLQGIVAGNDDFITEPSQGCEHWTDFGCIPLPERRHCDTDPAGSVYQCSGYGGGTYHRALQWIHNNLGQLFPDDVFKVTFCGGCGCSLVSWKDGRENIGDGSIGVSYSAVCGIEHTKRRLVDSNEFSTAKTLRPAAPPNSTRRVLLLTSDDSN